MSDDKFIPKRPVKTFHHWGWGGGMRIAAWKNDKAYSFSVSKQYKDKDGTPKISQTFFGEDLASLSLLCGMALTWCAEQHAIIKEQGYKTGELVQATNPPEDDIPF